MDRRIHLLLALLSLVSVAVALPLASNPVQVTVRLDQDSVTPFPHRWEECLGSGHALLGTRVDYREHLRMAHDLLGVKRIRAHGIFDDDMSVVFNGRFSYYNVDSFYDALVAAGVQPLVELSFMPKAFTNCNDRDVPCVYAFDDHAGYKGLTMPPTDYNNWYLLVKDFATHIVERYGREEVRQWKFEVWNEMWGVDFSQYMSLYNASYTALKEVDSELFVGGPATMQCQQVDDFIDQSVTKSGKRVADFVSTHLYPSDPECTNTTAATQEADCFVRVVQRTASKAKAAGLPFYLTEFNDGLQDGTHRDTSFAAAFVFRMLPPLLPYVDMISWWTFSDIFEEQWFDSIPFHNGFGLISVNGVPKPVFRAFELLKRAGFSQFEVEVKDEQKGSRPSTVTAFATNGQREKEEVQVFLSNWDVLDNPLTTRTISLSFLSSNSSLSLSSAFFSHFHEEVEVIEINDERVNPYAVWDKMGKPNYPTRQQTEEMNKASVVAPRMEKIQRGQNGEPLLSLDLPPYGVACIRLFRR